MIFCQKYQKKYSLVFSTKLITQSANSVERKSEFTFKNMQKFRKMTPKNVKKILREIPGNLRKIPGKFPLPTLAQNMQD